MRAFVKDYVLVLVALVMVYAILGRIEGAFVWYVIICPLIKTGIIMALPLWAYYEWYYKRQVGLLVLKDGIFSLDKEAV